MGLKSGVSMGGTIEHTRSKRTKQFIRHIDNFKKKNSKVCLNCESNKEGYCDKYKGWCGKVNYHCNGFEMSYQEKIQQDKIKKTLRKERQNKKKLESRKSKSKSKKKKSDLGQVIKPNFDTTKYTRKSK